MKKRIVSLALLAALLVGLCSPALAAEEFCFIAVDDTVPMTLTSGSLPYSSNAGLFVPYTVFNTEPCGVMSAYNGAAQTFVLFTRAKRLIFNLSDGTVTDENKNVTPVLTTYKNGLLYIPVSLCAAHFGLSLSVLTSKNGYMVLRFTDGAEVYDDSLFLEKAENLIAYRVEQYKTSAAAKPSTPTAPATVTKPAEPATKPAVTHGAVYPVFVGASVMQAAASALESMSLTGVFFLTESEIRQNPDLVRALYAGGHQLGLTVPDGTADVSAALKAADSALDAVLTMKTVMVLLTQEQAQGLSGYRVFLRPAASDAAPAENSSSPSLFLCTKDPAKELQALKDSGFTLQPLRETSPVK
jgi:hypothetical protein